VLGTVGNTGAHHPNILNLKYTFSGTFFAKHVVILSVQIYALTCTCPTFSVTAKPIKEINFSLSTDVVYPTPDHHPQLIWMWPQSALMKSRELPTASL